MTIRAELADGRVLEFPDGTDPSVIQATVKKMVSGQSAQPEAQPQQQQQQPLQAIPEPERSFGEQVVGGAENVAALGSGIVAEPLAGARGIGAAIASPVREFFGFDPIDPVKTIEETREAATFQPRTEAGQAQQQAIGETLAPIGEAVSGAEKFLGNKTLELTGSPVLATAAHTLPTAVLELLGLKGSKQLTKAGIVPTKGQVTKAITESAPEIETLKNLSRQVYNEIDDSGVTVKPKSVNKLIGDIEKKARKAGLDPRTTPRAAGALDVLKDDLNAAQSLTEIDRLRTVAQGVAGNIDQTEKALGNLMITEIDSFLDTAKSTDFTKGTENATQTAKKFKSARKLWGRARRAELIDSAITEASKHASGTENGIRIELRKILNSKKQRKFFPEPELNAMRAVIEGDTVTNMTKLVGKMGISDKNVLNTLAGIAAGGTFGGGIGAVAIPAIGTASRVIAEKLTTKKANFVSSITKAGTNGKRIAKAYLSAVPKAKRSIQDLADLLSDPNVDIDILEDIANRTVQDALEVARGKRAINLASAATTGALGQQVNQEQ